MSTDPLTIKRLTVRDVLRLSVVEITPDGAVVTLGGTNGSGKSSVLDSIMMAFAGARSAPPVPIRRGADRGEIVVDLGDIVVERAFTASGTDLVVRARDGAKYPRPQAMLDALFASVAFDPLAFSRQEPAAQADTLRQIMGVDVSDLDRERERVFEERTEVNRQGKAAAARLAASPQYSDAPGAEVDPAALARDLEDRLQRGRANADARKEAQRAAERAEQARTEVARLERMLEEARDVLAVRESAAQVAAQRAAGLVDPDADEVRARLRDVEAQNKMVRANRDHAALAVEVDRLRVDSKAKSDRLAAIAAERDARIKAVRFPVDGLGFDESGVTLDGLPFQQASTAAKLRVSVAIGVASNPRLRVFCVRDGSLLDADNVRLLAEMARDHGCQFWVEDARTSDPQAIIISDGTVRGSAPQDAAGPSQAELPLDPTAR